MDFHPSFKIHGKTFENSEVLLSVVRTLDTSVFHFLSHWFDEDDFVMVQTSGSTGVPKQIKLQKKHMTASARATGFYFNCLEGTKALICLSAEFIAGKMMWIRALTLGWDVDLSSPVGNPFEGNFSFYDFSAMVPLQVEKAMNQLNQVKKLIIGGAPVSDSLLKKLQEVSTEAFSTYGMTETITHIAVKKLNHTVANTFFETMPNVTISLDERGCLVIDAPNISDAQIITNDLVEIHTDNSFEWLGRYDSIINSGGVKLFPESIERKLQTLISERFFISSLPDSHLGEKVILLIESSEENKVYDHIVDSQILEKYEVPKEVFFISKFSETASAKIDKKTTVESLKRTLRRF